MKTLIIYDMTGRIIAQIPGSYTVPVGIPYLEVEIPKDSYPTSVNVSVTPNVVVYENIPKSDIERQIASLKDTIDTLVASALEG